MFFQSLSLPEGKPVILWFLFSKAVDYSALNHSATSTLALRVFVGVNVCEFVKVYINI